MFVHWHSNQLTFQDEKLYVKLEDGFWYPSVGVAAFDISTACCDLWIWPQESNQGLVNIPGKLHQDCWSRSRDIMVTRPVQTNGQPENIMLSLTLSCGEDIRIVKDSTNQQYIPMIAATLQLANKSCIQSDDHLLCSTQHALQFLPANNPIQFTANSHWNMSWK